MPIATCTTILIANNRTPHYQFPPSRFRAIFANVGWFSFFFRLFCATQIRVYKVKDQTWRGRSTIPPVEAPVMSSCAARRSHLLFHLGGTPLDHNNSHTCGLLIYVRSPVPKAPWKLPSANFVTLRSECPRWDFNSDE